MTNAEFYKKYGIKVTDNENLRDREHGIIPIVQRILDKEISKIQSGRTVGMIKRLKSLIGKYPKVPQFHNYLSAVYSLHGNSDQAYLINRRLLEKFPNYLFAITNHAKEALFKKNIAKAKEILGEELTINARFPDNEIFTKNEVLNYNEVVFIYYLKGLEDDKKAQEIVEMMEDLDVEHPCTERCGFSLVEFRMEDMGIESSEEDFMQSRTYDKSVQTNNPPVFNFPEIKDLYKYGLRIDHNLIKNILALPRTPLIADLEKVVMDALYRYEYFNNKAYYNGYGEEQLSFPLHAIFLLTELKAKESLPVIWELLKQDKDLSDFYFDDHLTETLWYDFYHLMPDDLSIFETWLTEDYAVYEFNKAPITMAIEQLFFIYPEKRPQVMAFYGSFLDKVVQQHKEGIHVDDGLNASIISNLFAIQGNELLPKVKILYDYNLVDEMYHGDFDSFKKLLNEDSYEDKMENYASIYDRYTGIIETWHSYSGDDSNLNRESESALASLLKTPDPSPVRKTQAKKIGRNDPCVCGSGRKYKKCCISKFR